MQFEQEITKNDQPMDSGAKSEKELFRLLKTAMKKEAQDAPKQSTRRGFLQAIVATGVGATALASAFGQGGCNEMVVNEMVDCIVNVCKGDNSCDANACGDENTCEASNGCTENVCAYINTCSGNACSEENACGNPFAGTMTNSCTSLNRCTDGANTCVLNVCEENNTCSGQQGNSCTHTNNCTSGNVCQPATSNTPSPKTATFQKNGTAFEIF